jgi:glycosyltransferase involved in cell wall biosynthesis
MLPISVCIIAKNEEKYIGECLGRLIKYDWEIIVVDTGSTDETVDIALSYTPNVFHFDWNNDFSAARNYSISKANNDYILVVDCDEYLEDSPLTSETIKSLPYSISPRQVGMLCRLSPSAESDDCRNNNDSSIVCENIARFFHKTYTHYQGSIHEQLVSKEGQSLSFIPLPISFYHVGYSTLEIKMAKADRNIIMLQNALDVQGPEPYLYYQLGQSYFGIADYQQALSYFEKALSMEINENEEYVQTLVESYGYCLLYLERYNDALGLEGIYSIFSKRADFVFLMGLIYMNNALFERAISEFHHATAIPNYSVEGVNSYKAFYNIGVIYECLGNIPKALKYYKKCGSYSSALHRLDMLK